jgi:V/A-type H+-transporting ATPase subunit I
MILPMKKYSFLLYHKELGSFLKEIQNLGVLHIIESVEPDDIQRNYRLEIAQIETVLKSLNKRSKILNTAKKVPDDITGSDDDKAVYKDIIKLQSEYEQISLQLAALNKDIKNWESWGEFNSDDKNKLEMSGLSIRFYKLLEDRLTDEFKARYTVEIISRTGKTVNFVVLSSKEENNFPDLEDIKLPEKSLGVINAEKAVQEKRKEEIDRLLDSYAMYAVPSVQKTKNELIDLTEMERANLNSVSSAENMVKIVQGWIPEEKEPELKKYLDEGGFVYLAETPSPDEYSKVPIVLKNNSYSKLFEPIGKLFSLPNYGEMDLTPYFAPFFMLFFGLCLGDAGYGVVMLIAATIAKQKLKPDMKPILSLVQFLAVSTIFAGAITGTIFGFSLADFFGTQEIKEKINGIILSPENMFNLAIVIGLIQIIFGLIVKAFNVGKQNNFMATLPTVGWLIMLVSGLACAMPDIKPVAIIFVWIGFAIAMLFSTTGNIFKRLGLGVWDMYNNIGGVFGDTLSYIRLFALGLSGSILGMVINSIGGIFLDIPYVGWLLWFLFLVVGHTGNLLLCSLGSFVHPMRLTFVEFYKNSGWTGGGKEYRPFSKKC